MIATPVRVDPAMPVGGPPQFEGACWIGELPDPLPEAGISLADGAGFQRARFLVRSGSTMRAFIECPVRDGEVSSDDLRSALHQLPPSPAATPAPPVLPFSVIVCTRDRPDQLRLALRSILELEHADFEVVVVDNASRTRGTADVVAEFAGGDIEIRCVSEPRPGLSRARNTGVREARHPYLAFTDDDVRVDRHWLTGLATGFTRDALGEVGIVTGIVPSGELRGRTQLYFERRVWWSHNLTPKLYELAAPPADEPLFPFRVGLYGTGANFAVARAAVIGAGGFDEALGVGSPTGGGEDIDMFVRLLDAGYALAYEPSALIWHRHRADDDALAKQIGDYGLGLGAWLTVVATDRRLARRALRRMPGAAAHLFTTTRVDTDDVLDLSAEVASGYRWSERFSVLRGPLRLARARRAGARRRPLSDLVSSAGEAVAPATVARAADQSADQDPSADQNLSAELLAPVAVGIIDLDQDTGVHYPVRPLDQHHDRLRVLVRRGGRPLGQVEVSVTQGGYDPAELTAATTELDQRVQMPAAWAEPGYTGPLSVVLCTRDRADQLRRALRSVLEQAAPDDEIVVVDNAPATDDTRTVVGELADERIVYVLERRAGLSVARNRGMASATHELVAFTDDDVVADREWLAQLRRAAGPSVDCVTGLVPTAELESEVQHYFERRLSWAEQFTPQAFTRDDSQHGPLYPFSSGIFGTGANFAIRQSAYRRVGPFDERLGAGRRTKGGEDLDYFFRLIWSGGTIRYEPAAMIWHVHRPELSQYRSQVLGYGIGFGAYAAKLLSHPRTMLPFLRRVPTGVRRLGSALDTAEGEGVPGEFTSLERRGMLLGPFEFARESVRARRGRR